MRRIALRAFLVAALVGLGWIAGRAQTQTADFELAIDAPQGRTNVTCIRGCNLAWVERG